MTDGNGPQRRPPRGLFVLIALISAAALAYEVLLMRMFSVIQWHHFAYIIISLALLGYGASGTLLSLQRRQVLRNPEAWLVWNALAFGIAALACFALAQRVPLNGLELIWALRQLGWLAAVYTLLAIPFLFAASCVGVAFTAWGAHIPRIYRWDLTGAGIGVLVVLAAMNWLPPHWAMRGVALAGLLAALALRPNRPVRGARWGLLAAALALTFPNNWLDPMVTEFKSLPRTLQISGSRVLQTSYGPLGQITVVENRDIPFRHAPGVSLANPHEPPVQLALFTDGDAMSVINRFDGDMGALGFMEYLPSALPYALLEWPRVLILGTGGGTEVLQALYFGASLVDGVELNARLEALVREDYGGFSGHLYDRPEVRIRISEGRAWLHAGTEKYDLIQINMLDSWGAASAGARALDENYLYTVEALQEYLGHLDHDGMIAITRWLKLPPRDALKLLATARDALLASGHGSPGDHLVLLRGWQTSTLLIARQARRAPALRQIREFAESRWFDLAWFPGIQPRDANRYNQLARPYVFEGATALLGEDRRDFQARYKFNIEPATDDRPYFSHFFRWRLLPELLDMREQGALVLLDSGYLMLFAALVQAIPVSILLILVPLGFLRSRRDCRAGRLGPSIYFLLLGLGFLFFEIVFIQRFVLYVGHPVYAAAIVIGGFLVFAGMGSGFAGRLGRLTPYAIPLAVLLIAVTGVATHVLLPLLFSTTLMAPIPVKLALTSAAIFPLAFSLGLPFPLGLTRLSGSCPDLVPLAWGINGCASVLSALAAPVLAIHLGFQTMVFIAVGLYAAAALSWRR